MYNIYILYLCKKVLFYLSQRRIKMRITTLLKWSVEDMCKDIILDAGETGFQKIKNYFGFNVALNPSIDGKKSVEIAVEWIKKYYNHMERLYPNKEQKIIKNKEFIFKLDEYTYCWVTTGNKIRDFRAMLKSSLAEAAFFSTMNGNNNNRNDDNLMSHLFTDPESMNLYFFGKKSKKYMNEFSSNIKSVTKETLYNYSVSGSIKLNKRVDDSGTINVLMSSLKTRNIDTLYFDNDVKEKVISHIDNFLNSEKIYVEKDLPFKTGIMLYGEPGTGKSSLATAIASYYKCSIIVINMSTFDGLNTIQLAKSIDADELRYIVLLEDIDTMYKSLDRDNPEELDIDTKKTINKLLQFLDSPTNSPTNVIFIATTNHIEMLDEALLRTGRFDLKINVAPICKETAISMAKSFNLSNKSIDMIIDEIENEERGTVGDKKIGFPVNQSYLQGKILKYIKIETLGKNGIIIDDPNTLDNLEKELEILVEPEPEKEDKDDEPKDVEENILNSMALPLQHHAEE